MTMELTSIQPRAHAADLPLEQLAKNTQLTDAEKVAELSRQFEAVLLRQILSEAQKPVLPSKFSDNSTASVIYRDMTTFQLADSISKSGAFGLAGAFRQQLTQQIHEDKP